MNASTRVLSLVCFAVAVASTGSAQGAKSDASPDVAVSFSKKAKAIVVTGNLTKDRLSCGYKLAAKAGETLNIKAEGTDNKNPIRPLYHIVFPSGKTFGTKGYDPFDGKLTETGTYRIVVERNLMATDAVNGKFRLTLTR